MQQQLQLFGTEISGFNKIFSSGFLCIQNYGLCRLIIVEVSGVSRNFV
jgi:hypothetical protein